jgi:hypothetical protein
MTLVASRYITKCTHPHRQVSNLLHPAATMERHVERYQVQQETTNSMLLVVVNASALFSRSSIQKALDLATVGHLLIGTTRYLRYHHDRYNGTRYG